MILDPLRNRLDALSNDIIALFAERLNIVKEIARMKKKAQLPLVDPQREADQRETWRKIAIQHQISPAVIEEMFSLFVDYSKLMMKMEMEDTHEKDRLPRN